MAIAPDDSKNVLPAGWTASYDVGMQMWTITTGVSGYTLHASDAQIATYNGDFLKILKDAVATQGGTLRNSIDPNTTTTTSLTFNWTSTAWTAPARKGPMPIWGTPAPEPPEPFYSHDPVLAFRSISYSGGVFQGQHNGSWNTGLHIAKCNEKKHLSLVNPSPGWECNCGIYAHKLSHIEGCGAGPQQILTLVAMEHVIEHEDGYRAGKAWVIAATRPYDPYRSEYPGNHSRAIEEKRIKLLIEHTWPLEVPFCATPDKLYKVYDYMSKNPDQIQRPTPEMWEYCAQEERNR